MITPNKTISFYTWISIAIATNLFLTLPPAFGQQPAPNPTDTTQVDHLLTADQYSEQTGE